jgi:hypothetical protein
MDDGTRQDGRQCAPVRTAHFSLDRLTDDLVERSRACGDAQRQIQNHVESFDTGSRTCWATRHAAHAVANGCVQR